ncbi:glycosyltransferase family 4 protein [Leptobacterium sp. I13]|uniref:glycosyltransferase family 4 protein n=1 Tax=Leptobacterium meishanense TaxID=3128904 RepID=UPI0030ED79BE
MKKVLIITYYWPPAGGPGVQRWLKFVKYLPESNIKPIVFIPENPSYPIVDKALLEEIPKEVTIIKHPIKEPYKFANILSKKKTKKISSGIIASKKQSTIEKILLWIRGNCFIPDARILWVKPSEKFLLAYIEKERIETVITTGPPHSVHLIGKKLKEKMGIQWIADFRDPWTTIGYHKKLKLTQRARRKHKKLEKGILNAADDIIVTSPSTKQLFETTTDKPIIVITNGYDAIHDVTLVKKDKKFTLSHIGSLLTERNPLILWEALSELINENKTFKNDFILQLVGIVGKDVLDTIHRYIPKENTQLLGYVTHNEVLKLQSASQVLLLIEIDSEETACIIPGKLFEYLYAKRPIVAIGPKNWDVVSILEETKGGKAYTYDEKRQLKEKLLALYNAYRSGNLQVDSSELERYSRKALTKKLVSVIK